MPALVDCLLKDDDPDVRSAAAQALCEHAAPALQSLLAYLKSDDSALRSAAAEAFGKFRETAAEALPALVEHLKDENGAVRSTAAKALGKLGSHSEPALPALVECLGLGPPGRRVAIACANDGELFSRCAHPRFPENVCFCVPRNHCLKN